MGDELKSKMLKALTWTSVDRFGQQLMQLVIGVVLARLLSPHDYGLIGVLTIFIGLSTVLIDGGFGQALIRKQNASDIDYSTIFYLNLSISVILYLVLFFSAPLVASFFSQPGLVLISRVLFLTILFYAVYFIQYVVLNKKLDFKKLALINISSLIISGIIGIVLALNKFGVWALVWQQISSQVMRAVLFPLLVHWKPIKSFSFRVIREFWNFSIHLLGTTSLNVVFNNIYTILLGRFYPLQQVGYYNQATKLNDAVNAASQQILMNGTYPLLVQIQEDKERLKRVFRKLTKTVSLLVFPLIAVLVAIARPLIIVLITDKWLFSVVLFQLLLIANYFGSLYNLNISILNARGESKQTFRLELLKKAFILISVLFCFSFGIKVMLSGYVLACFIAYFLSMFYIKKSLGHYFRQQFEDIIPNILLSILLGLVAASIGLLPLDNFRVLIIIQLISVAFAYALIIRIFYPEIFYSAIKFISQKLKLLFS